MGLKAFQGLAEGVPIQERHHLSICLDKNIDGFASVWYKLYAMELRMTPFSDPFHDPWKQLDISMAEAGLKTSMILSTIGHNLDSGPWDGQAFGQQEKDTAAEMVALMGPGDQLLDFFWPRICWDLGLDPEAEGAQEKYLKEFTSFGWLKRKGPRVCMTRWGTWAEVHEFRAHHHHSRLLLLVSLGLRSGWLAG